MRLHSLHPNDHYGRRDSALHTETINVAMRFKLSGRSVNALIMIRLCVRREFSWL